MLGERRWVRSAAERRSVEDVGCFLDIDTMRPVVVGGFVTRGDPDASEDHPF